MGAARRYFREQFRLKKLTLDHVDASDFYLGSWQSGGSPVPLLCIRLILFLGCIAILISSLVVSNRFMDLGYWPIFMTHWGIVLITITSGSAFFVSAMAAVKGSIDSDKLPWYVKLYWASFSVTVTVAFFITIFYYVLLYAPTLPDGEDLDYMDPVLDVFVHGVNSIVMFCLLATARHPLHLLQFLYPFLVTILYMAFSIIYYYAGGTNQLGASYIYPMLDWSNPGPTSGLVFAVAALLLVLHILAIGLSHLRDCLIRRYTRKELVLNADKTHQIT